MDIIFHKNNQYPIEKVVKCTNVYKNQDDAKITVFEGPYKMVKNNKKLGEALLKGIYKQAEGAAQIECLFSISHNGELSVKLIDN